jgi:hypothetical protein
VEIRSPRPLGWCIAPRLYGRTHPHAEHGQRVEFPAYFLFRHSVGEYAEIGPATAWLVEPTRWYRLGFDPLGFAVLGASHSFTVTVLRQQQALLAPRALDLLGIDPPPSPWASL